MRWLATMVLAALAGLTLPVDSHGATGLENARILLHLVSAAAPGESLCAPALPNCSQIVTHGDPYPAAYYAYVLVTDVNPESGLMGVQFGIDYGESGQPPANGAGIDIWGWTLCADVEYVQPTPVWPSSGGGNLIIWNTCQNTVPPGADGAVASPGFFYLGSYGDAMMQITERPVDGMAKVANCGDSAEEIIEGCLPWSSPIPFCVHHDPSHLGSIGFGAEQGWNPCGVVDVPVQNITWGRLKTLETH